MEMRRQTDENGRKSEKLEMYFFKNKGNKKCRQNRSSSVVVVVFLNASPGGGRGG